LECVPESGIELIIGDFVSKIVPSALLASRDALRNTSPLFLEEICCLAVIMCETCRSGYNPGFEYKAKSREIITDSRTNCGRDFRHVSDSRTGLIMGDFVLFFYQKP